MSGQAVQLQSQMSRADRAAHAWSNIAPHRQRCTRIEMLQEKKNSAVYCLQHAGPHGENIIAKWVRSAPCAIERTVYENILPRLGTRALRCFGNGPDEADGFHWIFVEQARGDEYDSTNPAHRAIASSWLAGLHSSARELAAAMADGGRLPSVGPRECANQIHRAMDRIGSFIGNPALAEDDRAVLGELIGQCELLLGHSDVLDRHCRHFQPTLVHGDFVAKNLRICVEAAVAHLLVFDWEMAGYGVPAADLAECDDPANYRASVGGTLCSRTLTPTDVESLVLIGKCLRWAAAVDWASWGLEGPWVRKPMRNLRCYRDDMRKLAGLLRQAGLAS
jgi:hypothetical protein